MSHSIKTSAATEHIPFKEALLFWLKLGFISFGGPAGQIAILHQELVEKKRWISENRFLHALNYCMLLPGPEAQQLATYLGWLMHRTPGGLLAGLLFILPSLLLLIGLGWLYQSFGNLPAVAGLLYGIKPAVTAIVLAAAFRIGSRTLKHWFLKLIALLSFAAIQLGAMPFPVIVVIAAVTGAIISRWQPQWFTPGNAHAAKTNPNTKAAIIDDHTPPPPHARFSRKHLYTLIVWGLLLWGGVIGMLCHLYGWQGALTQMGWFFTKAALLTFGGAYAVLPYVYQGAVDHYHWLTAAQMMDGLALGETTPGPLIMVITFAGFVAGWGQALFGADQLFLSATVTALIVTYFTFLPSFLFILAGGPLVESTHGRLGFQAPLTGITAAVVGVIVNLAVFLGYQVFWPNGLQGPVDWIAIAIGVTAFLAMTRFKTGIIPVILASAVTGILASYTGF